MGKSENEWTAEAAAATSSQTEKQIESLKNGIRLKEQKGECDATQRAKSKWVESRTWLPKMSSSQHK